MPGTPGGGSKVGADYGYIASGKIDKEGKLKEGGEHGIGNYFHPGGIQTIGDWVVVPVADSPSEKKSEIRFYKYKGGLCEEGRLRIHRKGNAGSVGITNYGKDGDERYLLATLPNHREIHFYWTQPGIPLSDQQCYFKGPKKWNLGTDASSKIKSIWKGYNNNCSLVADKEGSIYFIGLEAMQGDLYKVSIDVSKERGVPQLSHIKSFEFKLKGGPKFRWGASVLVTLFYRCRTYCHCISSSKQWTARACYLGLMYYQVLGATPDLVKACAWFTVAAVLPGRLLYRCHIVNIRGNSYRMRRHAELSKAIHPHANPIEGAPPAATEALS